MKRTVLGGLGVATLVAAAMYVPAGAAGHTSNVHAVHGVPGLPVDVCIDGAKVAALEDFQPEERRGPLALEPGDYDVSLVAADATDCASPAYSETVSVPEAGLDLDLVAHLSPDGSVNLTPFVNDAGAVDGARLVVRHTADFGPVDVLANGSAVIQDLDNPDAASVDVPAASYDLEVTAAGDPGTVAFAADAFAAEDGVRTTFYAIGDPTADPSTFTVLVFQTEVGAKVTRISGTTRFETAAEISRVAFPEGAEVVYLATGEEFADALAAKSLEGGPVLLTPSCGALPDAVRVEIQRLSPERLVVLGGTAAVCDAVADEAAGLLG